MGRQWLSKRTLKRGGAKQWGKQVLGGIEMVEGAKFCAYNLDAVFKSQGVNSYKNMRMLFLYYLLSLSKVKLNLQRIFSTSN